MGPHHKQPTFPAELCDECYTLYSYTKNNHIQAKKVQQMIYRFKMAAKLGIFIFGDYEYVYITNIKFGNFYSYGILGAKNFSPTPLQKC